MSLVRTLLVLALMGGPCLAQADRVEMQRGQVQMLEPAGDAWLPDIDFMRGPFPNLRTYCQASSAAGCVVDHPPIAQCGKAARGPFAVGMPFLEARIVFLGGLPGTCDLAVRTDRGWYVIAWQGDPSSTFLTNTDRYHTEIERVAPGDHGTLLYFGNFLHSTLPEKMPWLTRARFAAWYECERRLFVCGLGASGRPSCAGPYLLSYTTYCRDFDQPTRPLRVAVREADFEDEVTLRANEVRLRPVRGPSDRQLPLPGWRVGSLGKKTVGHLRNSSPLHSRILFP